MQKQFSQWLDTFRWMAAFAVLISHSATRLLDKVQNVEGDRSVLHYAYQFMGGFSHPAVMVFFVLSGFFVGGSALAEFRKTGDLNLHTYFVKRVVRLSVVLWPALLLTAVFDAASYQLNGDFSAIVHQPGEQLTVIVGVCNAAYLNTLLCQHYGSNVVLWSLANEFWYYVLFPLGLLALASKRAAAVRAAFGAIVVAVAAAFTFYQYDMVSPMLPYFSLWLLGVWASAQNKAILKSVLVSAILVVGYMLAIRIGVRHETQQDFPALAFGIDLVLALLFANLLVSMRLSSNLVGPPAGRLQVKLAEFSYSLYCVHIPALLLFLVGAHVVGIDAYRVNPTSLSHWLVILAALTFAVFTSFVFSRVTEAKTAQVRELILRRNGIVPIVTK